MPMQLDLSDAFDESFTECFTVLRRQETIPSIGPATISTTSYSAEGVVTAASPNDLKRLPEFDMSRKAISIVTQFRLQLNSVGYKPDIVQWGGDNFLLVLLDDYSHYGAGFVEAIAASIDYQDVPPHD